jgi:hypothetical protein
MVTAKESMIPDDAIGQTLRSVSALVFDVPNEPGSPTHEAICLHLDSRNITIRALTDDSELCVNTNDLTIPHDPELNGCYTIADISRHRSFDSIIGKHLRNWWLLTNDSGYHDGFMIAFTPTEAVCFIAMNNVVSILNAAGEQCS